MGFDPFSQNLFDRQTLVENKDPDPIALRRQMIQKSPAERRNYSLNVGINVDGFRVANKFIDGLIKRARQTPSPGGLWLLGDGGVGKTYVLERAYQRYAPFENELTRQCPVLLLSFDSRPSESSILLELLLQLGQNPATLNYKRNADLADILIDAIPACGTSAILFDEAHHLWLNSRAPRIRDRVGGRLGDFLKRLYDRLRVTSFIFAGTPGLEILVKQDSQAATRWSGMLKMENFAFDEKFVGLLGALDQALPMQEPAGLSEGALPEQIHAATKGNFRLLKRLLAEAVYIAASEQERRITATHLAGAYFEITCKEEGPFA